MLIYMDRAQCEHFGVEYFGCKEDFVVASDTLCQSKGGAGYDMEMTAYMKSVWGKTLVMRPSPENGPGWYTVAHVI